MKNNVSYLRQKLDNFLDKNSDKYNKASSGKCTFLFNSSLDKSFNRSYTDYFVNERHQAIGSLKSPKSKDQYIGKLLKNCRKFL